jgi:hypothetical protein
VLLSENRANLDESVAMRETMEMSRNRPGVQCSPRIEVRLIEYSGRDGSRGRAVRSAGTTTRRRATAMCVPVMPRELPGGTPIKATSTNCNAISKSSP